MSEAHCTFVDDELALSTAELAQVEHGDVVVHAHGVLEGARVLDGCSASPQTPMPLSELRLRQDLAMIIMMYDV